MNIFKIPADGSSPPRQITDRENWPMPQDWSRAGTVVFAEQHPTTGWDIWTLAIDGHEPLKVFAASQSNELAAAFSPDGQWIVYSSNESGRYEIYVQPYPARGRKWTISSERGFEPRWRGQEVFFRGVDKMMVCEVKTEPSFVASKPRVLFETPFESYDVTPDGRRFALVRYVKTPSPPRQINVILGALEPR